LARCKPTGSRRSGGALAFSRLRRCCGWSGRNLVLRGCLWRLFRGVGRIRAVQVFGRCKPTGSRRSGALAFSRLRLWSGARGWNLVLRNRFTKLFGSRVHVRAVLVVVWFKPTGSRRSAHPELERRFVIGFSPRSAGFRPAYGARYTYNTLLVCDQPKPTGSRRSAHPELERRFVIGFSTSERWLSASLWRSFINAMPG